MMIGNGKMNILRTKLLAVVLAFAVTAALPQSAFTAASTFYATTAVSAGDVVVWDTAANYGVKTTAVEAAQGVAGVADESVTAGNDCTVRQDGGHVVVNIIGSVARGQWLITSTTAGKAKAVDSPQAGVFACAVTPAGTPAPGQCYATLELGFLAFGGGPAQNHALLSNLNWAAAGHTFDSNLNVGAYDFQSTGQFTNGSAGITAAQGKTAYDHSQAVSNVHGLTYSAEGEGGGLDTDTLDGSHSSAFAGAAHTHTESQITDLDHDAQKLKGKPLDDSGLANGKIWKYESATLTWKLADDAGASSGAPTGATYITQTHDAGLSAEQALADLSTGLMKNAAGTGVVSIAVDGTDYSAPGHTHTKNEITDFGAFVDRGDPAAFDYTTATLAIDGTWHDLDLSAIVPVGAKAILLRVRIADDVVGSNFGFRKNGNANSYNVFNGVVLVVGATMNYQGFVACDSNRVIEYTASNTTWTYFDVIVLGWLL